MSPLSEKEVYISVDVETAGPNPHNYSLLSLGACTVWSPRRTFYIEIKPTHTRMSPEAQVIHHLHLEELIAHGVPPKIAMRRFANWVEEVTPAGAQPVFVAFNAPFDWMFVNDYFHHYLGYNPFGYTALDIKALYMGATGVPWSQTSKREINSKYLVGRDIQHQALSDALDQAEIFAQILTYIRAMHTSGGQI